MSFYSRLWGKPAEARAEHEKAWLRAKSIAWDAKWQALSVAARRAYLLDVKAPSREGSMTQQAIPVGRIPEKVVEELTTAEFIAIEPPKGKKSARAVANQAAYDFSARLRSMHRYNLLGQSIRENLAKFVKYAFSGQGEPTIHRVLHAAGVPAYARVDEALELYVTTRRWPEWAMKLAKSKASRPLYDALVKAGGPVRLARLESIVKGVRGQELGEGLTELVAHLAVFEDVDPATFELVVGLLPCVRDDLAQAARPRVRPPLVVCEHPKQVGPPGGLDINDLRVFLLEVAGESPRLRQDGLIFAKDEPRLLAALPARPTWVDEALKTPGDARLKRAYALARSLRLVEIEHDEKAHWLRLSGKARNWLAAGFEDQYARIYNYYQATKKQSYAADDLDLFEESYYYGDSKFLGVPVSVIPLGKGQPSQYYYQEPKPEHRDATRAALLKVFKALPVGVFYRWDSVLDHSSFAEHNPLTRGEDFEKLVITIEQRRVPALAEQVERTGKLLLDVFLRLRLLPLDAVRAGVDAEGKLCIARLPRLDGYFGRPYAVDRDESIASTKVIVQPDFSVLVIGLDPSPAAEIAPFCERAGGHAGQGAMTFKITRDSVIRAAGQGLLADAIVARLKKHASVDIPENVLREVREWAAWVRLVNIQDITVVRCPDKDTVARVVSALGKKAERLGDTLVALNVPKLTTVERQRLQEHGILITKAEITIVKPPEPPPPPPDQPDPAVPKKNRGRPKKLR